MTWVAVATIAGGAIVSGLASQSAADTQANAAQQAGQQSLAQYQQTRSDLMPWQTAGKTGLASLMNLSGQSQGPLSIPQSLMNSGVASGQTGSVNPGQFMKTTLKDDAPAWFVGPGQQAPKNYVNRATGEWGPGTDPAVIAKYTNQSFDQAGYQAAIQHSQGQQQTAPTQAGTQQQNPNASASSQLAGATQNSPLLAPFSLKDFQESPAYQFNLDQGMQAINKAAAARGQYYAPQTLQDVSKYTQGMADNEFNNAYNMYNNNQSNVWNRLYALQGTGQSAAAQTGAFGANAANTAGQATMAAGNAQAAGTVGVANAITGATGDLYNQWLTSQILNQRNQSIYAP